MAKFKKKTKTSQDIPTSALPDIIFMLLFFFMVTTVLRQTDLMVEQAIPKANQLAKLEKKSLVSYIYIGKPKEVDKYGAEPRIQVNGVLITPDEIAKFVLEEKEKLEEAEREKIVMSLKVDRKAKMGVIIDVKQKLRDANALKVNYAATKDDE
jgi:biopolymer transport protein ExbD